MWMDVCLYTCVSVCVCLCGCVCVCVCQADSSECLRQCGLSQLFSVPVLVTRTRVGPVVALPTPIAIPRWKLIRPRRQHLPTDEPKGVCVFFIHIQVWMCKCMYVMYVCMNACKNVGISCVCEYRHMSKVLYARPMVPN